MRACMCTYVYVCALVEQLYSMSDCQSACCAVRRCAVGARTVAAINASRSSGLSTPHLSGKDVAAIAPSH